MRISDWSSDVCSSDLELFRDLPLKLLQFGIHEFNDISCFHVNQVIVMRFGCSFVARATVAEIMTFQNARFLEQADGAVDRGNGYTGIDGRGALVKLFYVGMILRLRKDACNHTALLCDSQSFFSARSEEHTSELQSLMRIS